MKILVTGGAGFVGSHVVDHYLDAGHDVAVVDDLYTGRRENVDARARFYHADIRSRRLWDILDAERPDVVNHHAARADVRASMEDPATYADVNVTGGINLLEASRRAGVRKIIYASTGGCVYGELRRVPADESHPIAPRDPYGASKAAFELYLPIYSQHWQLRYTILRYPNVYGPRQDPHGEAGVVAIFLGQMLTGSSTVVNGDGLQERDFLYVADVARANLAALHGGDGEAFNLGHGQGVSVLALHDALAALTGYREQRRHGPAKAGEIPRSALDASKIARALGWKPEVALDEGLRRTVAYFRARGG
ncbi:MAG TPA: NAD-dependent epimerase/dehydratase family protein [Terriglobales bacterium]|nr:NAD-dependent epimerase/dehydratase family protein [Terriglobales bacterium]